MRKKRPSSHEEFDKAAKLFPSPRKKVRKSTNPKNKHSLEVQGSSLRNSNLPKKKELYPESIKRASLTMVHHSKEANQYANCPNCSKKFNDLRALKIHMITHFSNRTKT